VYVERHHSVSGRLKWRVQTQYGIGSNPVLPSATETGSEGYLANDATARDAAEPPRGSGDSPAVDVKTEQDPADPSRPASVKEEEKSPWANLSNMFVPHTDEEPEVRDTSRASIASRVAAGLEPRDRWHAARTLRAMVVLSDIFLAEAERLVIEVEGEGTKVPPTAQSTRI
jgi:hypothetical protein